MVLDSDGGVLVASSLRSRVGLLKAGIRMDSPAMNPGDFQPQSMAEVDHRGMQWHLDGFRPELELVASTTAFVAVVAVPRHVHRERPSMLGFGFVQRAVSVPLICSTANTVEAEQVEYLLHGDLVAQSVEVDTRHG